MTKNRKDTPDAKPSGKHVSLPNPFQTATDKGKAPKFRFSSAASLLEVYRRLQESDEKESLRRARIKRHYDGYRPYDRASREAGGLKNLTNINGMGLKGTIDALPAALHDMALDTTNLVELRPQAPEFAGPDAAVIADVVAEEFSTTLRDSRKFLPALAAVVREAGLYGLGPVSWPDYHDYQPVALERGQLKFPDDSSAVSSDNELYMIETQLPAWYLFDILDNREESAAEGWRIPAVERYVKATFSEQKDTVSQTGDSTGTSYSESAVSEWRQNRAYESRQFETLRVVQAYVREVHEPRKVTHYIAPTTSDPDDFLFVKPEAFDNMDQCVLWLPFTVGERYARAVRGLASYRLPIEDMRNKFLCQICDVAFRAASFVLQSSSAVENQKLTITENGPYLVTGAGLTAAQSQVAPNFQQLAAVNEMLSRVAHNSSTGSTGPMAAPERVYSGADRKTKDQVAMEAESGRQVEKARFILQSTVFDAIVRESFRRFMNLVKDPSKHERYPGVKEFIKRCKRRQIPLAVLRKVTEEFHLYTCRDLVIGGAEVKAGMIETMLGTVGGNLDEVGRVNATRDLTVCRFGRAAADRYRPAVSRDDLPSDAASHAVLENNDMYEGSSVLAAPEQLHWSHIPVHMQIPEAVVQAVQSGQTEDPQKLLDVLERASEHIRAHAEYGGTQTGMENAAKRVMEQLRSLRPVVQALTMMAAAQQREQEAEQERQAKEMDELRRQAEGQDAQVEMHKTDVKASLAMREQNLLHEARLAGVEGKNQAELLKAKNKAEIDRITANMNRIISASKIAGENAQTPMGYGGEDFPELPVAPAGGM